MSVATDVVASMREAQLHYTIFDNNLRAFVAFCQIGAWDKAEEARAASAAGLDSFFNAHMVANARLNDGRQG